MMTVENRMVEIKAGPELDRAVAEAIGVDHQFSEMAGVMVSLRVWDELMKQSHEVEISTPVRFRPSRDLNAAFAAAEKVRLFDCDHGMLRKLCDDPDTWCFGDPLGTTIYCSIPALAICAGILKLKSMD